MNVFAGEMRPANTQDRRDVLSSFLDELKSNTNSDREEPNWITYTVKSLGGGQIMLKDGKGGREGTTDEKMDA